MKAEQLSDALEYVGDGLLDEAAQARSRKRRPAWRRWGALAACLVVAAAAGSRFLPHRQPQELPIFTIQSDGVGGMGFEGYLAFDYAELQNANPWNGHLRLDTLPVYENPLTYDELHQALGTDVEQMRALLLEVAGGLGLDTESCTITDDTPSAQDQQAIREMLASAGKTVPEGYFAPTALTLQGDGAEVEVEQNLTATISFTPAVELPEDCRFTYDATYPELEKTAGWLAQRYAGLLAGMEKPVLNITGGDRNIYGKQSYDVEYYDGGGTVKEQIVAYNFRRAVFYGDDEGKLFLARVFAPDLSKKLGDYPVITAAQAKELLLAGHYATSAPEPMPGEAYIAGVDLVYRTGRYERVWLPYYRFYVELPDQGIPEQSLKCYGAYYVPAVEGQYIANMPTYDGRFN